jgi:hypothetical protein
VYILGSENSHHWQHVSATRNQDGDGRNTPTLEPNALTVIITKELRKAGGRLTKRIQIRRPCDQSSRTHFQPAALRRQAYSLPMSPMPMMPMLFFASMIADLRLD